jgi:outer membrane protein OmpA-like peptidoglycan-associated protein
MIMRLGLFGAASAAALLLSAPAQAGQGWYVGIAGGGTMIDDIDYTGLRDPDAAGPNVPLAGTWEVDTGWAAFATVGYGLASWRLELEGGYRHNGFDGALDIELDEWTAMVNALYEVRLSRSLNLSVGGGVGGDFANLKFANTGFDDDQWNFAWQGIAGLSFALSKDLDLTLDYRYLRVTGPELSSRITTPAGLDTYQLDDLGKHTLSVGLRFALGGEAAPPPAPLPPPPPPPPKAPTDFIIFFGHDSADLLPEAYVVIRQAAAIAKDQGSARISVVGHADRSGSDSYNDALSLRRASNVKTALVAEGIAEATIGVTAKGETSPLVPTDDGVREPQNRRVDIALP